jgi:hypothetical protein
MESVLVTGGEHRIVMEAGEEWCDLGRELVGPVIRAATCQQCLLLARHGHLECRVIAYAALPVGDLPRRIQRLPAQIGHQEPRMVRMRRHDVGHSAGNMLGQKPEKGNLMG